MSTEEKPKVVRLQTKPRPKVPEQDLQSAIEILTDEVNAVNSLLAQLIQVLRKKERNRE